VARFHEEHEREFSYRRDDAPVEIYQLQLVAVGATPKPVFARHDSNGKGGSTPQETRPVWFDELDDPVDTPVYHRESLPAGTKLTGPAIVDQLDSTTLVPPDVEAEVDEWLNIRMHIGGSQ
jgi:N-methylhydantoinase A